MAGITEFKTERYIVRERSENAWTVEGKEAGNVIGEIKRVFKENPWCFDFFFSLPTRAELLEIEHCMQRVENITKSK